MTAKSAVIKSLPKAPTGIKGLDEVSYGGLPRGRPTLICGSAGCGKTLMAMEFIVRGATEFDEPGVVMAFEETAGDLTQNVKSLGFDLDRLVDEKKLVVDFVRVERSEIEEVGEYDLDGLFVRLGFAIDSIGAKRVVLDTLETLFGGLTNQGILRSELRRLFHWLKEKGVTAVITGERGEGQLTRHGLEEYVSDCVILLDHRVVDQISTRHLRIVKYRGTVHGTNEYPFLIDEDGINVLPITSVGLDHEGHTERISSGVSRLDTMLGGEGFYRGSTVLVSGAAGSGKSSLAAYFARAACERGERCIYFAFEESPKQIMRNMRSIGIDLEPWLKKDLLRFHAVRSSIYGIEMHLAKFHKLIDQFQPQIVIIDPVSNLIQAGSYQDAMTMAIRLIDFLKMHSITSFLTDLTTGGAARERSELNISSLVDSWLLLRDIENGGERNRAMYILKSRGMSHSNQIREFLLTDDGIQLEDVYRGTEGVLTGSARLAQEARERAATLQREQEVQGLQRELERKREALKARITALEREFEAEEEEAKRIIDQHMVRAEVIQSDRDRIASHRQADGKDGGINDDASKGRGKSRKTSGR